MMSCVGVMYQPYSSTAPLSSYLSQPSTPTPAPSSGASPSNTSPTETTPVYHQDNLAPLPLKREHSEKVISLDSNFLLQNSLPFHPVVFMVTFGFDVITKQFGAGFMFRRRNKV